MLAGFHFEAGLKTCESPHVRVPARVASALKKRPCIYSETLSDSADVINRHVAFGPLNRAQVRPTHLAVVSKRLLA